MPPCRAYRKALFLVLLAVGGPCAAADVSVARVATPWGNATNLHVAATQAPDGTTLRVRVEAFELRAPELRVESFDWRCTVVAGSGPAGDWRCEGTASARTGGTKVSGRLALAREGDATSVVLRKGDARATLSLPASGSGTVALRAMPLDWLAPLLAAVAPTLDVGGGRLRADFALDDGIAGELALDDVGIDTPDGTIATAGLDAAGRIALRTAAAGDALELDLKLTGGEWLVAPLYSQLGGRDVSLALRGTRADGAGWTITEWRIADAGALAAQGTASLAADGSWQALDVAAFTLELPAAWTRYIGGVLAAAGLGELASEGRLAGRVAWRAGERWRGRIEVSGLSLADPGERFAIEGVAGHIDVRDGASSELAWRAASLYRMPLGASRAAFEVDASGWRLREPVVVPMLGGALRLDALTHDERAGDTEPWRGGVSAQHLDLGALTAALGWPAFGGELSLKIPSFAGTSERIAFAGAIDANVFDGRVRIDNLALERPFGVAPSLAADIAMDDLDLALLTGAFSFGSIEGRLDGRVSQLRLVDFTAVAFDAELHTDPDYKGKRRISQRAVANLSSVGGAGAALSSGVARIFDSFPYAAIGLRCRLANNVCTMGGLEPEGGDSAGAGYVIVRGSGIPRLTVQGFQRRVDWPVLVARLREATSGVATPVVD